MNVIKFRPYRVRKIASTEFFTSTTTFNKEFAQADLARSGLTLDDMHGYANDDLQIPKGATAGYFIPYWTVDGDVITDRDRYANFYRVKLAHPPYSKGSRYHQPSSEELHSIGLPSYLPYLYPCPELEAETIYCCEGEKKTVSVIKNLGLPAFGISGCTMWGNPAKTGGPHPWTLEYLKFRGAKRIIIIPDGDILKYDICTAYGTYANALVNSGYEVEILNPPDKIDDLIVQWGSTGRDEVAKMPRLKPEELNQSPVQLAKQFNLAFKRTKDDTVLVEQHSSNVTRLLENHPAFPRIWRNTDNNTLNLGDEEFVPAKTVMDITNHFQHNFGLSKVTVSLVETCLEALAKKNQSSPMLEYIKGVQWDGVPRLETWMTDTWGIIDEPFTREVSKKWLIAACARLAQPGAKVDWMLIVVGPQGTGKTTMPSILFKGANLTLYGEHNDKDLKMLLHSALCVGFDELDSFNRKDSNMLKAMITTTEDMFRPPYGSTVERFQRRFSLYGCGNRYEFLQNDPSGQRRYAVVECPRLLDFTKLESIRDQLWAEAWHTYNIGGTAYWEVEGASEHAKRYEVANLLQEKIQMAIAGQRMNKANASQEFKFTMSTLFDWIGFPPTQGGNGHVREAAAILKALGYTQKVVRVGKDTCRYYFPPV